MSTLAEVAIEDVSGDLWEEDGPRRSAFRRKVRIGIICFLIRLVAVMDLVAVTAAEDEIFPVCLHEVRRRQFCRTIHSKERVLPHNSNYG